MAETTHDFADFWAVHAEREGRPFLADWAKTENDAKSKMATFATEDAEARAEDPELPGTEFWVMQMTESEADSFKTAGVIPDDA